MVALRENLYIAPQLGALKLLRIEVVVNIHPQFGPATGCSLSQSFGDSSFGIGSRLQVTRYGTPSSDDV